MEIGGGALTCPKLLRLRLRIWAADKNPPAPLRQAKDLAFGQFLTTTYYSSTTTCRVYVAI